MDDYRIYQRFVQRESNRVLENVGAHVLVIVEGETFAHKGGGDVPSPKLRPAQVHKFFSAMLSKEHSILQVKGLLSDASLKRLRRVRLRTVTSVTLVVRSSDRLIGFSPSLLVRGVRYDKS